MSAKYKGKTDKVKGKTVKSEDSNTICVRLTDKGKRIDIRKISSWNIEHKQQKSAKHLLHNAFEG